MALPTTTSHYTITAKDGLDGLILHHNIPIPSLGPQDCLLRIAAVSLNYRDVAIPTGKYPLYWNSTIIPTSDGAGTIVAVGEAVTLHRVGGKVCTLFTQAHQFGPFRHEMRQTTLGSAVDGPLRQWAVYPEQGLVAVPSSLGLVEASTLPCAAVTAWNALNGLEGMRVGRGDVVLCQGTGGVSLCESVCVRNRCLMIG